MGLNRLRVACLLSSLACLSACVGKSPPARFYMLEPVGEPETAEFSGAAAKLPVIAIAPVQIPKYVDRPQIVTASDKNRYALDEFHRWAERLDDNIARVLAQNLTVLVPADRVLLNASTQSKEVDFRVVVALVEFHVDPAGEARFAAQWSIARGSDWIAGNNFTCHAPASTADYQVMVEAQNICLSRLSREIAAELRQASARPS